MDPKDKKPDVEFNKVLPIDDLIIASWYDGDAEKPIEVHLVAKTPGTEIVMIARFVDPQALALLIGELTNFRREVWPDADKIKGEKDETNHQDGHA